jgi:hypothetical protein
VAVIVKHSAGCPNAGMLHSDAAKRVSDTYRLHKTALGYDAIGQWFAAALADGSSNGVLYETKRDAVRCQHHNEQWYAFIQLGPWDMDVCEAESFIGTVRALYDAGLRLPDPDHARGGRDVITRATREDQRSLIASIANRGRTRPSGLVYPGE